MRGMLAAAGGAALGVAGTLAWQKWARSNDATVPAASAAGGRGGNANGAPPTPAGPKVTEAVGSHLLEHRKSRRQRDDEALPEIFKDLAGNDGLLGFSEFEQALQERVHVSLGDEEIKRVWSRLLRERRRWAGQDPDDDDEGDIAAKLTFEEFKRGVQHISFLRSLVRTLQSGEDTFVIPPNYDYSKSSNDNYCVPPDKAVFVGEYTAVRKKIDYSYHVHYSVERQRWQDRAINSVVSRTEPQGNPWIVYTCGPMGAGKGFVLSWMSRNGYFPLEDIVCIDPDHFKKLMPEWPAYVKKGSDAGTLCHRESGFLQEIAQEVAMRSSQNIWIDGSLRDGTWFVQVFKKIRRRYPNYKIAIFEVGASEEVVRKRIKTRAIKEGRNIPEHLIIQSLSSVADSLNVLMPLADFVARIDNSSVVPQLRAYIRVNADGNWSHIQRQFARNERAGDFPASMAPIVFRRVIQLSILSGSASSAALELRVNASELAFIRGATLDARLASSPLSPVTLSGAAREVAGIPQEAVEFAFVYPAQIAWDEIEDDRGAFEDCHCLLAMAGGFVYFDTEGSICGVNAVSSVLSMEADAPEISTPQKFLPSSPTAVVRESSARDAARMLQFCPPQPLPAETIAALAEAERLKPVTLAYLIGKGAETFAWIAPGELLPGLSEVPQMGAFAYVFKHGQLQRALKDAGFQLEANDTANDPLVTVMDADRHVGTRKGASFASYLAGKPSCEGCYFPVAT